MKKTSVLLADGQTLFRSGLRSLLTGYDDLEVIGEAADGAQAVKLAAELKPDVTIMDVSMPILSGIEAAKQIKESTPECHILMLCGLNYDSYFLTAMRAKVDGFLHKEVGTGELISAVRSVKNGKHVLDETTAFNVLSTLVHSNPPKRLSSLARLSEREIAILKLAAKGSTNKEIAASLNLTNRIVQLTFSGIFRKLKVHSRIEATVHALKQGWISPDDVK